MGSSKPCPGCGKVVDTRRGTEVCYLCQIKLESYPNLQKELERINADKIYFKIGSQPHWNRYFLVNYAGWDNKDIASNLREAIFNVCMAGSTKADKGDWTSGLPHIMSNKSTPYSSGGGDIARASSQEFFDSIQSLMEIVQKAVNVSYEAGQNDGGRFMVDIAEGKKSIQDYEDKFVKQEVTM